jgi:hypothetical protein
MQPEPWLAVGLGLTWSTGLPFVVLCDGWAEDDVAVLAAGAEDDVATTGAGGGAAVVGTGATGTAVAGGGGGGGAGTDETCEL